MSANSFGEELMSNAGIVRPTSTVIVIALERNNRSRCLSFWRTFCKLLENICFKKRMTNGMRTKEVNAHDAMILFNILPELNISKYTSRHRTKIQSKSIFFLGIFLFYRIYFYERINIVQCPLRTNPDGESYSK